MATFSLLRWGGLAYLLAGLSLILQQIYGLVAPETASAGWVLVHTLGYFGLALGLLGFPGIYASQRQQVGALRFVGFVVGFIGNAMTVGAAFLSTFVVPIAPNLVAPTGPLFTGPAALIILLSALLVAVGFILFGIATYRANVLPRGAALLVIVSAWFGLAAVFSPIVFDIAGAVFGLGSAWLGYALWSGVGEGMMQPTTAV